MKTSTTNAKLIYENSTRLDGKFHASDGMKSLDELRKRAGKNLKLNRIGDVCLPAGIFIGGRARRTYVQDPSRGIPFLSSSDMLMASFESANLVSKTSQTDLRNMILKKGWVLISRSGTIGNMAYVRDDMEDLAGSEHIMRVAADLKKISPGYLYTYLSSPTGQALIKLGTFGSVIDTISPEFIADLPIPRLNSSVEEHIHALVEQAATLRVRANALLKQSQERFYRDVLGFEISRLKWKAGHVDAFAIGKAQFNTTQHRLDAFHYVGYTGEAEAYLSKTQPMGDLVEPYQPPMFKRPYTGENGIPFLSGIDLYDAYPKPHMYISRKMERLDLYIVDAGTILVQNVGQRYGLFGRPTILPKHLGKSSVTQHMMRVYPKNAQDRGFVYIWLSTEIGRRLLLKESFGTSMGVLFERSFKQMPIPVCQIDLRHSFEADVQTICEMRDKAIALEDQAQMALSTALQT